MAQITYTNKETLNEQPSIADKNKVKAEDMNEIKSVVNTNYGEVGDIANLNTTDKSSVVNAINEIKGGEIFSTTEVKTNKVWIDGKPIYRKVYTGTYSGSGNISISTPDIENIINNYGYIKSKYDNRHVPIPSIFTTDSNYNVGISYFPNNRIEIRVGGAFSNISDYALVVEYIKSS